MTAGPISTIPREARLFQGRRAGLVTRFVASAIDAVVVVMLLLVGYLTYAGAAFLLSPRRFQFPSTSTFMNITAALLVLAAYLALGWATSGRTYGDHVMGLRVVSRDGTRLGPARAIARSLLSTLFPIGLFWCAVNSGNYSVQDLLLRTTVVYDWNRRAPWRTPPAVPEVLP
jgi:uncharacterized RDD family membrane protein YckC